MRSTIADRVQADAYVPVFASDIDLAFAEICEICDSLGVRSEISLIESADRWVRALFSGRFPGYRAANTPYHDIRHTYAVTLTMARILSGKAARSETNGEQQPSANNVVVGVIAALFHDVGYIQDASDLEGTGAKHTFGHESRSGRLASRFLREHGVERPDQQRVHAAIEHSMPPIPESGDSTGEYLTYADLYGQMADREYLERLLFLYREFAEGGVEGYSRERDILSGTRSFFRMVTTGDSERAACEVSELLGHHFRKVKLADVDLYRGYIDRNIAYLDKILQKREDSYRLALRRGGIVQEILHSERENR